MMHIIVYDAYHKSWVYSCSINVIQYDMPTRRALMGLLFWCLIFKSSHCNSFEEPTPPFRSTGAQFLNAVQRCDVNFKNWQGYGYQGISPGNGHIIPSMHKHRYLAAAFKGCQVRPLTSNSNNLTRYQNYQKCDSIWVVFVFVCFFLLFFRVYRMQLDAT